MTSVPKYLRSDSGDRLPDTDNKHLVCHVFDLAAHEVSNDPLPPPYSKLSDSTRKVLGDLARALGVAIPRSDSDGDGDSDSDRLLRELNNEHLVCHVFDLAAHEVSNDPLPSPDLKLSDSTRNSKLSDSTRKVLGELARALGIAIPRSDSDGDGDSDRLLPELKYFIILQEWLNKLPQENSFYVEIQKKELKKIRDLVAGGAKVFVDEGDAKGHAIENWRLYPELIIAIGESLLVAEKNGCGSQNIDFLDKYGKTPLYTTTQFLHRLLKDDLKKVKGDPMIIFECIGAFIKVGADIDFVRKDSDNKNIDSVIKLATQIIKLATEKDQPKIAEWLRNIPKISASLS